MPENEMTWEEFNSLTKTFRGWKVVYREGGKETVVARIVKAEWIFIGVPVCVFTVKNDSGKFTLVLSTFFNASVPIKLGDHAIRWRHSVMDIEFLFVKEEYRGAGELEDEKWFPASVIPVLLHHLWSCRIRLKQILS